MNTGHRGFRLAPTAQAIAWVLAAGGVMGQAHAAPAFSQAWFATMGTNQSTARTTGMVNGKAVSAFNSAGQQQQANAQLQQSIANLGLAAQGIAAQQAAQAAARQTAMSGGGSSVPDGLAAGGLDSTNLVSSWVNANAPTQSTDASGKTVVDIQQTADKAIANWNTFNVGKNTIVQFDQQPDWAILNRINDPAARPSQIEGQIKAAGTVLIVNRNGIVFSGTSQVNTRNLVAAAADIADSQFTTNGIYGVNQTVPSFTDADGTLDVQAGAQLNTIAPGSATESGGYVLLMGQQVHNAGTITTPQGQAELAAGDSFIIRHGVGTDGNAFSTTRGNEISPQFDTGSIAGQVVNAGLLMAQQGDITLAGHDVQQNGVAVSTTTVNTRGTIHLLNAASDASGSITLGTGATTAILLEDDGQTALDSQRDALIQDSATQNAARLLNMDTVFDNLSRQADREDLSRIEIVSGGNVDFQGGSMTLATGGQVAVSTGNTDAGGTNAGGRVQLENNAQVDVSGAVGVQLAMSSNDVQINIQGNEQRDAPANRDSGALNNDDVWIDRRNLIVVPAGTGGYATERDYTPGGLLEVSGYLGNVGHTVGEWDAQGGTITLAGNEVVTQPGSTINISGGSLAFQPGYLQLSWLIGANGQLYMMSDAPANMAYTGIYQGYQDVHPRWGASSTQVFYSPLIAPRQVYEDGYTVGRDAGTLILSTPTAIAEGGVVAAVYNSDQQQQAAPAGVTDGYKQSQDTVAQAGTLALGHYDTTGLDYFTTAVTFGDGPANIAGSLAIGDPVPADRVGTAYFDADQLSAAGLGGLAITTGGMITLDAPLTLSPGAQVSFTAPIVDIAAALTDRGGNVSITNIDGTGTSALALTDVNGLARATLEKAGAIDTQGLWINGELDPVHFSGAAYVSGGNVSIDMTQGVALAAGSVIDTSSGAAILPNGKTQGGAGGNITLIADDPTRGGSSTEPLTLDGTLRAYGVTKDGALTLQTGQGVVIGDQAILADGTLAAGQAAPVQVLLAGAVTYQAGQTLPLNLVQSFSVDGPGQSLATAVIPLVARGTSTLAVSADWTVPSFMSFVEDTNGTPYFPGATVPAGTVLQFFFSNDPSGGIPAGYVVPADAFPQGIPIAPVTIKTAAGTVLTAPLTMAAGTVVPGGTVFNQKVAVQPLLTLSTSLFGSGFSSYTITGANGVTLEPGAQVKVTEPVYQFTGADNGIATGADPSAALSIWTPPLYQDNPLTATLTQRAGASLTLATNSVGRDGSADGGGAAVSVGAGARVEVDPEQSINIASSGQITIDGVLQAPGGAISITDPLATDNSLQGQSIWIGSDAVLDVSARARTATDRYGRTYGVVPNAGSITLGEAGDIFSASNIINSTFDFIVIRPGALLDASGANALIDPDAGTMPSHLFGGASSPLLVASNGGSITLSSYDGIYADGTMSARAGGPGAAGGSFNVTLETAASFAQYDPTDPAFVPRIITIGQEAVAPQLPADLQAGMGDPSLQFGQARFSAETLAADGFDNLSFTARDAILFDGNVNLTAGQSIAFHEGAIADTGSAATVVVSAPHVILDGNTGIDTNVISFYPSLWSNNWQPSTQQSAGTFTVNADLIDISNELAFGIDSQATTNAIGTPVTYDFTGFGDVDLASQGDIRFLPQSGIQAKGTTLETSGDLTLTAAQLYPVMPSGINSAGAVMSTRASIVAGAGGVLDPNSVININRAGNTDPAMPYSALGQISFTAGTINQGGIVRAPEGSITLNGSNAVNLLAGSITSTSMNGLTVLFGGTVDGVNWSYNGVTVPSTFALTSSNNNVTPNPNNISLNAPYFSVAQGAVIDVSGGGDLAGAGFISGEGGSVDILKTSLVNVNPANRYSNAGNPVYAIVPGYQGGYAPVDPAAGAAPGIGQQITIAAGVPGLPAGTYTLLPATYALLPGGYRIELGQTAANGVVASGAVATGNGAYLVGGYEGTANTGVRNALATQLIVMPGSAVRDNSDYNETDYDDFAIKQATTIENIRPPLQIDGGILNFNFSGTPRTDQSALVFDGSALFGAGTDAQSGVTGQAGQVKVFNGNGDIEVDAGTPTPDFAGVSVSGADLSALAAPSLTVGSNGDVTIDSGVDLKAAQVLLVSGVGRSITLQKGAEIDTIGMGTAPTNLSGNNIVTDTGAAELAVSNGVVTLVYKPATDGSGNAVTPTIDIEDDAKLYSEGSIGFAAGGPVTLSDTAVFGTANLGFSAAAINIGNSAAMASATVPQGIDLTQSRLDQLLAGDTSVGAPPLKTLTLTATDSLNIFGSVDLDIVDPATGKADLNLVLNTPAVYGYGSASDTATLTAGTLTWSGIGVSNGGGATIVTPPGPVIANGPGTGAGTLDIVANRIVFGFPGDVAPDGQTTYRRVMLGFSNVNLSAPVITSNNKNTLAVYQVAGADPSAPGTGGNLTLETSLLTGDAGSIMGFTAGGTLNVAPAAGATPAAPGTGALGGEIDLTGNDIDIAGTVLLPSGRLVMDAVNNIHLASGSSLDLAGQATTLVDQVEYSWGGDVILRSAGGNIVQDAGSTIDVSAANNNAGSISAQALGADAGQVAFNGTLVGASTLSAGLIGNPLGGSLSVAAQNLASGDPAKLSADFAALNTALNADGFSGTRAFDLRQGDLVIGDEVKAHQVSVSLDNGSLTINGTIDASGVTPGSISLAALHDLTLNGTLDAHGTALTIDSYGNPIDAENRGTVSLTTAQGTLALADGATIDVGVTASNGVQLASLGDVELNAPRTGTGGSSATGANAPANATGDGVAVFAPGTINIKGASTIAVNAFTTYTNAPADPADTNGQVINQGYLDQIDSDSRAFMSAAGANPALRTQLAGLIAYGSAFHLRPGIEVASATVNGNLTVQGDLDLSGYRYSDPNGFGLQIDPAIYGSGEPGVLVLRAGGNLNVDGSVTDGFGKAPNSPDDGGWSVTNAGPVGSDLTLTGTATIGAGSTFGAGSVLGYSIPILGGTLPANTPAPTAITLASNYIIQANTPFPADINADIFLAPGDTFPSGILIFTPPTFVTTQADWTLPPGGDIRVLITSSTRIVTKGVIPAGSVVEEIIYEGFQTETLPANVFPAGFDGGPQTIPQGTILPTAFTVPAGTQFAQGTVFPTQVAIQAPPLAANTAIPVSVTLAQGYDVPVGFSGSIVTGSGSYTAGQTIPSGTVLPAGTILPDATAQIASMVWPAGDPLVFASDVTTSTNLTLAAGSVIPAGTNLVGPDGSSIIAQADRHVQALAPMLAAGDLSWSLQLVSGADTAAADTHVLQPLSQLAGGGSLTLNDPHIAANGTPTYSVIRTGTGSLDLLSGGNVDEETLFGVYTAGTQASGIGPSGSDSYNLPRGQNSDGSGTVLGFGNDGEEVAIQDYSAYYPTSGGNLRVSAQGDLTGLYLPAFSANNGANSNLIGNWLWTQGGAIAGQQTAWWINFGTYAPQPNGLPLALTGFTGFGALGGGNVVLDVGGNASDVTAVVASTGRVLDNGTLAETGGGALTVNIGGSLNGVGNLFTDLRGNTSVNAGTIGNIVPLYGQLPTFGSAANDPRHLGPLDSELPTTISGGMTLDPGDGTVTIATRGDLVLNGVGDPVIGGNTTPFTNQGTSYAGGGSSSFSLWTDTTAINLFSAGGNVTPTQYQGFEPGTSNVIYPSTLNVVAASGSIFWGLDCPNGNCGTLGLVELAPSANGQLNLLAQNSIIGAMVGMSGADPSVVSTPFNPAFIGNGVSNLSPDDYGSGFSLNDFFAFGADTPTTNLHANDPDPIRIYAATGDIVGLELGAVIDWTVGSSPNNAIQPSTWYIGAKSADIVAGRDIVVSGTQNPGEFGNTTYGFILNANPADVSFMSAGRDILLSNMQVGGPGQLVVQAGNNYYGAGQSALNSLGPVFGVDAGDRSSGAGIALLAGVGAAGPDYTDFAKLYFNTANQADAAIPDTDPANAGKVPMTYADQLYSWLQQRFGYAGSEADALAYFLALPSQQQGVFVRQVYFEELDAGGKEFNDPASKRFQSYLRGRDAIASLFPSVDAEGNAINYQGDITLFGNSGIHTDFGGAIQTLTPGGQTLVGVDGVNPPGTAGVVTQGSGDIDMYSLGSILLGQSRVMTTFGGNVLAWSATGDINAGRGSKTTQVFTPPRRVYDTNGNVTLSPDVPSSGAGFATLAPLPEVPAGDMNLVAPLGTIDAGEAGIRVSGNVNLAALQVVNGANIQVQGKSAGLPIVAAVNTGALTSASAAAAQATTAAENVVHQQQAAARQALQSVFTVTVLGFGSEPAESETAPPLQKKKSSESQASNGRPYNAASPLKIVGVNQNFDPELMRHLTSDQQRRLLNDK